LLILGLKMQSPKQVKEGGKPCKEAKAELEKKLKEASAKEL
jgi:hypothetical protein